MLQALLKKHRPYWQEKRFLQSVALSISLLAVSVVVNNYANIFAVKSMSNPVTDIILDNVPVFNVGPIIVYGAIGLIFLIILLFVLEPKRTPFIIKSVALFVLIRAVFISLTHIAPFPGQLSIAGDWFSNLFDINGAADLFFSGHTGLPFLMALTFWQDNLLRTVFLFITIVFAVSVLLGHLHYSIDVFAAFFITYTIFEMSKKIFSHDYHLFTQGYYLDKGK